MIKLDTDLYLNQAQNWPKTGNHILAQYDQTSIIVYQAYRPAIGNFAVQNHYFGGDFSLNRMSWIKPNFLWMMFRSGWGTKADQEMILAIRLQRQMFDRLLAMAVHSSFIPELYTDQSAWKKAIQNSSVRLQWDPDHDPAGTKLERRAIQLGLRDQILAQYAQDWILEIIDISDFVHAQRQNLTPGYPQLLMPQEAIYPVDDAEIIQRLQLTP
jgi:Domain of unknown function (DUF4291)